MTHPKADTDPRAMISRLSGNVEVFRHLFEYLSTKQARWKPGEYRWSQLEVINHFLDEQREDIRQHLDLVLTDPQMPCRPSIPNRLTGFPFKRTGR